MAVTHLFEVNGLCLLRNSAPGYKPQAKSEGTS